MMKRSAFGLLAAVALGGLILAGCSSTNGAKGAAPILVDSTSGAAAIIQWVPTGDHLSGTYVGVEADYSDNVYSIDRINCAVRGVRNQAAITLKLTACSDPSDDGSFSGQLKGSDLTVDVPLPSGAVTESTFVPHNLRAYNLAVKATRLLVKQGNALNTYLSNLPPSDPCGQAMPSQIFSTPQGTEIIVFRSTNTVCNNSDSREEFDVLKWYSSYWLPVTTLPFDEIGGPQKYTSLNLGANVVAIGVKEETMIQPAYEVLADFGGQWRFVPFDAPGVSTQGQSNDFAFGVTMISPALTVVEHYRVCGQTSCSNETATLHYDSARMAFVP